MLGCERAMVLSADDGLDELSLAAPTRVIDVPQGGTEERFVNPWDLGLDDAPLEAIAGGSPEENAETTRAVLAGKSGPPRDVSVLNAAATICVAGQAKDMPEGVQKAEEAIDSGAAQRILEALT